MNKREKSENDRWIRDLRWVISSPFLMNCVYSCQGELLEQPEFEVCEISEEEVEAFAEKYSGHRVGYYFESLIYYWLKHVRKVEILAQGFQVIEEGRTLGEIDFIFRDEEGRVNHWEVAAKFYLYCADQKVKGSHYIGPNAQDTFELKREKIFGKQLPLSEKAFPEVSIRQAFVKGRVFYHPKAKVPDELPQGMMPNHSCGIWIRCSELFWLESEASKEPEGFHLIEKPFWLAPECLNVSESPPLTFRELKEHLDVHFSERNQPILVNVLVQREEAWHECYRVFVVADDWPGI